MREKPQLVVQEMGKVQLLFLAMAMLVCTAIAQSDFSADSDKGKAIDCPSCGAKCACYSFNGYCEKCGAKSH